MTDHLVRIRRRLPAGYSKLFGGKTDEVSRTKIQKDDARGVGSDAGPAPIQRTNPRDERKDHPWP
jgi:hypothetical protein